MHEDLARERSKAQELAQQMLNQALELDELQRDSSDTFGLRQQLVAAQQAEAQLRGELQQLRRQAAAAPGSGEGARSSPRGGGGGALQGRSDRTAAELAAAKQEVSQGVEGKRQPLHWCCSFPFRPACSLPSNVDRARLQHPRCAMPCRPSCHQHPLCLSTLPTRVSLQAERLREERDLARHELEQRDGEVMQLQGQLVMLQEQVPDEGNWLAPLPDPYH
jgi:hypothetical protein